jgi:hypothetical protein
MPSALLHDRISRDTVQALETLLEGAKRGQVVGAIFGVMLKRRKYLVNVAGEAVRDPTFARGMVGAIEDELRVLIQGRADADTTM